MRPFGQASIPSAVQSNTVALRLSALLMISLSVISSALRASTKPPLAPLKEFKSPARAKFCKILAKKLREIPSSLEIESTSIDSSFPAMQIIESRAYSLAFVKSIYSLLWSESVHFTQRKQKFRLIKYNRFLFYRSGGHHGFRHGSKGTDSCEIR